MKALSACLFLVIFIASFACWTACQRSLKELLAGNESLRRQLETPVPPSAPQAPQTNTSARLSQEESLELLRLRGQLQPLRREWKDLSNRVATLTVPQKPGN
jgi:hypothetical protein